MEWIKRKHIFLPDGRFEWMNSHTNLISAVVMEDRIRVFYSTRSKKDSDGNYISYPSYIDLDKKEPTQILYIHDEPILKLGDEGSFDQHGIMVSKVIEHKGKLYLYYCGWQRLNCVKAPYRVSLGLATSIDNGLTFEKISAGPVLGQDMIDVISIGAVDCIIIDGKWYMAYTSYKRWEYNGKKATPQYNIKLATSEDGINWQKENTVLIEEDEKGGVATPSLFEKDGKYYMMFGYRKPFEGQGAAGVYHIGYAESDNCMQWKRNKSAGIDLAKEGWDSKMVCYPNVVKCENRWLMFYCGNGFGESGFGYAELA